MSHEAYIESKFGLPKHKIKQFRIKMKILSKKQCVILNEIILKEKTNKENAGVPNKLSKDNADVNELMELCYMGKIYDEVLVKGEKRQLCFRQILVRRKRLLEILFTNGLIYMNVVVPESAAIKPYVISDIMLSANNSNLIVFYSILGKETSGHIKIFKYNQQKMNFVFDPDSHC